MATQPHNCRNRDVGFKLKITHGVVSPFVGLIRLYWPGDGSIYYLVAGVNPLGLAPHTAMLCPPRCAGPCHSPTSNSGSGPCAPSLYRSRDRLGIALALRPC